MTEPRRVWVVGRGAVSAFGLGAARLLDGVFAGERALRPRAEGRFADVPCGAEVLGLVPAEAAQELNRGGEPLALSYARAAAREALEGHTGDRAELGLVLASTKGDLSGVDPLPPGAEGTLGLGNPARLTAQLAAELGLGGPTASLSCACSSGLSALGLAGGWLRAGRARRALVVGVDALSPFVLAGFTGLLALDPGPCRPYDRQRRGLSLGEGAGALLLSFDPEDATSSLGELAGWGESNDANHVTGPSRDGGGLARAARRALARVEHRARRGAGPGLDAVDPGDVDLLHLHGTGTRYNDASEALGLAGLFAGPTPPAVGTKGQTGHTLGAAGLLETLIALEALARGALPGNAGLEQPDVDPRLSLTRGPLPLARARVALKLSAGFGGINAALVLRREEAS